MLKVLSRSSALARRQVEELMALLPARDFQALTVESYGDKHQEISLLDNTDPDFFTRELDEAILRGEADIAIHSAKDLPYPLHPDLRVIALTAPGDCTDCLAGAYTLQTLPPHARVGVSSPSRRDQLLAVRPDLECVSIRGTIEQRLDYIDRGQVDAILVATCALHRLGLEHRIGEILPFKTHPLQGHLAVTARYDRPDLKALFYPVDHRVTYGRVTLMGFGPGSPGLLTLRGHEILQEAEIIYHDDLIDQNFLQNYPAPKVYVGKRKEAHHKIQDEIHELLYQSALQGLRVVRVKGGDPFIYGRGGEELALLRERMIPVDVLPGISAVQAAGVSLDLPLTQRGVSDQLHIFSGHHAQSKDILDDLSGTLAFYMASTKLDELQAQLLSRFSPDTPAAAVQWASQPWEKTWRGTIAALAECPLQSPLLILAGPAAAFSAPQSVIWHTGLWPRFTSLPYRILHYPLIEIRELAWSHDLDWDRYQGIIFTSQNAVDIFLKYHRIPQGIVIAAIGPVTAARLEKHFYDADILPPRDHSGSLAPLIEARGDIRFLYPGSDISLNELHNLDNVERLSVYTTLSRKVHPEFSLDQLEGVIFTSASTIRAFAENFPVFPDHLVYYVRGPLCMQEIHKYPVREANIVSL